MKIKLFANLRKLAAAPVLEGEGDTIFQVLSGLSTLNPALGQALMDGGALRPHVRVVVNGKDIELLQGLDTPVHPQDELAIFPPIAGG